jgi:BirA family biotin operon repressor/biotin-[acetyl-CoA-carboxylase] ligase
MVNDRKLAGLLIDQFVPGSAVVGIGINVTNRPESYDPTLEPHTARLADFVAAPDLESLTGRVLGQLRLALLELAGGGAPALLDQVNKLWGQSRTVELDLNGTLCRGLFKGIDLEGRLVLADECGKLSFFEAHQVRHLTEMEC